MPNKMNQIVEETKNLTLLYVEDDADVREATSSMLAMFFPHIIIAIDGNEGLKEFMENQEKIDIIMSDINMPKLTGIEMATKIREINKEIPILLLSAYKESDFSLETENLAIDGYIFKPIEIAQFLETLEKTIQKLKE